MEYTPFAGLTALDENDPIAIDGASFLIKNPRTTDHLLQVGCVTHRHDGHAPLPNPTAVPSGSIATTGGQLAADTDYAITYTALDSDGGETAAAPAVTLTTPAGLGAPTIAPTAAPDYTQGIMPDGSYFYALTYTDGAGGETAIGPSTFAYVEPGYASGAVALSGLSAELSGLMQWRLWRSYEGADWHLVAQDSTDTFLDAGFDPPDNPAQPPGQDSTSQQASIQITLPSAGAEPAFRGRATGIRIYLAPTTSFVGPCLYDQLPISSAGHTLTITADTVQEGSPPPVSTSTPGAAQINALTDVVNLCEAVAECGGGGGSGSVGSGGTGFNPRGYTLAAVATIPNTASAGGLAFTPDGTKAYIINTYGDSALVPVTVAGNVPGTVTDGAGDVISGGRLSGARAIAVTPDGSTVYVTLSETGGVAWLDVATDTIINYTSLPHGPLALAITPDGTKAYIACWWGSVGTVVPFDLATNTPGTPITVGNSPAGIAITPDGTKAYVTNSGDNTVTPIDLTTDTAGTPIALASDAGPQGIAITPDGSKAYVACYGNQTVVPITVASDTAGAPISLGLLYPYSIASAPDGTKMYAAGSGGAEVLAIDVATDIPAFVGVSSLLNLSAIITIAISAHGVTYVTTTSDLAYEVARVPYLALAG